MMFLLLQAMGTFSKYNDAGEAETTLYCLPGFGRADAETQCARIQPNANAIKNGICVAIDYAVATGGSCMEKCPDTLDITDLKLKTTHSQIFVLGDGFCQYCLNSLPDEYHEVCLEEVNRISDCDYYDADTKQCHECREGFVRKIDGNTVTCQQLTNGAPKHCLEANGANCLRCQEDFLLINNQCQLAEIYGCAETDGVSCTTCLLGYGEEYVMERKTCFQRVCTQEGKWFDPALSMMDPAQCATDCSANGCNCLLSAGDCVSCKPGFYNQDLHSDTGLPVYDSTGKLSIDCVACGNNVASCRKRLTGESYYTADDALAESVPLTCAPDFYLREETLAGGADHILRKCVTLNEAFPYCARTIDAKGGFQICAACTEGYLYDGKCYMILGCENGEYYVDNLKLPEDLIGEVTVQCHCYQHSAFYRVKETNADLSALPEVEGFDDYMKSFVLGQCMQCNAQMDADSGSFLGPICMEGHCFFGAIAEGGEMTSPIGGKSLCVAECLEDYQGLADMNCTAPAAEVQPQDHPACNDGYLYNAAGHICLPVIPHCVEYQVPADGDTRAYCVTCADTFGLVDGGLDAPEVGLEAVYKTCEPCISSTHESIGDSSACTTCTLAAELTADEIPALVYKETCTKFGDAYYKIADPEAGAPGLGKCDSSCAACATYGEDDTVTGGSPTLCTKCAPKYAKKAIYGEIASVEDLGVCVKVVHEEGDPDTVSCAAASPNCDTCDVVDSNLYCKSCKSGSYYYKGVCIKIEGCARYVISDFHEDGTPHTAGDIQDADTFQPRVTCDCGEGYYLGKEPIEGVAGCDVDPQGPGCNKAICKPCGAGGDGSMDASCLQCDNKPFDQLVDNVWTAEGFKCKAYKCADGYIYTMGGSCRPEPKNCYYVYSEDNDNYECTTCWPGYGKVGIAPFTDCVRCAGVGVKTCSLGDGGLEQIDSCFERYVPVGTSPITSCRLTCGTGYLSLDGVCKACPLYATECSSATVATACVKGYYLAAGICNKCVAGCKECGAATTCLVTCNEGFFAPETEAPYTCTACAVGCKTCSGSPTCTATSDNDCMPGYFYSATHPETGASTSGCYKICPAVTNKAEMKYYFHPAGRNDFCTQCPAGINGCDQCTSFIECATYGCKQGYQYNTGACVPAKVLIEVTGKLTSAVEITGGLLAAMVAFVALAFGGLAVWAVQILKARKGGIQLV